MFWPFTSAAMREEQRHRDPHFHTIKFYKIPWRVYLKERAAFWFWALLGQALGSEGRTDAVPVRARELRQRYVDDSRGHSGFFQSTRATGPASSAGKLFTPGTKRGINRMEP